MSSSVFILWMPAWILVRAAEEQGLLLSNGCPADSIPSGRVPWLLHWATLVKLQSDLISLIGLGYNPFLFLKNRGSCFLPLLSWLRG